MTTTLKFKTNINCRSCVARVQPYLDQVPSIESWTVETGAPDKVLTVTGEELTSAVVSQAVKSAGYSLLGEVRGEQPNHAVTSRAGR